MVRVAWLASRRRRRAERAVRRCQAGRREGVRTVDVRSVAPGSRSARTRPVQHIHTTHDPDAPRNSQVCRGYGDPMGMGMGWVWG